MLRLLKNRHIVELKEAFKRYIRIVPILKEKEEYIWYLNMLKKIY